MKWRSPIKDCRRSGRSRIMRLALDEFIRRFLLRVLPDCFHRIRHYGFLAKGELGEKLARVQRVQKPDDGAQAPPSSEPEAEPSREPFAVCPDCGGLTRRMGRIAPHKSGAFRCDTS
jgi:hypothetical protein